MKLKIKSVALLGALALLAGCASSATLNDPPVKPVSAGQDSDPPVAVIENTAEPDRNKVRCSREAVTGSRLGQRVCRTEAEWEGIREASQDYTREVRPQVEPGEP